VTKDEAISVASADVPAIGEVWHIVPRGDLREHELSPDCWCCPFEDPNVLPGTLFVHQAADEREKFESGERRPS